MTELGSHTFAMETLERLVEIYGLASVLEGLAQVSLKWSKQSSNSGHCHDAADHEQDSEILFDASEKVNDRGRRELV